MRRRRKRRRGAGALFVAAVVASGVLGFVAAGRLRPIPAPARPSPRPARPGRPGVPPEAAAAAGRLAVIIDDVGSDPSLLRRLDDLGVPLTIAVLPGRPHSALLAGEARGRGWMVLLHLPMEPDGYPEVDPGPGALLAGMSRQQVDAMLAWGLAQVPGAAGVNNHMGSRTSRDPEIAEALMESLAARRLCFLDSRTTPASVLAAAARSAGLPTASRDVFLDDPADAAGPRQRLREAAMRARRRGTAVAIGHGRPETLLALREEIPRLQREGIVLVTLDAVVHRPSPSPELAAGRTDR